MHNVVGALRASVSFSILFLLVYVSEKYLSVFCSQKKEPKKKKYVFVCTASRYQTNQNESRRNQMNRSISVFKMFPFV